MANKLPKIPEVRIYFSWLLYENVSVPIYEHDTSMGKLESRKAYAEYAAHYRYEWAKYSKRILGALTEALGITFYQSVIDAPCTPGIIPISSPLILNFAYYPAQFIDSLTHELCHVLLTDNSAYSVYSSKRRVDLDVRWEKLFGDEHDAHTLEHIPVHALCKYMYLDVLEEPDRLERDMENLAHLRAYKAAWDYVNAHDYREIVVQLKADYRALARELA